MLLLSLEVSYQMALGIFFPNPSCDSLEVSENERSTPDGYWAPGPTARAWGSAIRGWVQPL